ncbi:MAG TPA: GvpL/GvpF family gas vesicle protein [Polyangia bacterium]|nr:GvpL/GvpF family gas vesicle protein [Polyangia bacterium]
MIYLYAIVDAPVADWTWVHAGGVYAVVAAREKEITIDETAVREHDAAVREIEARVGAILPVRFGTAVRDDAELESLIAPRAKLLADALALVAGRAQMTVRLFSDERAAAGAGAQPSAGASGTQYLEERARAAKMPELDFARAALGKWIQAERVERHATPPLVGSAYHLVARADVEAYAAAARQIAAAKFRVAVSGPFPPYAFAPVLA